MSLYRMFRPLLFRLDPEAAHRLAVTGLRAGLAPLMATRHPPDPRLATKIGTLDLANPIGLAAGCDKHAEAVRGCFSLGFGFVEVGGVTPRPQPGNPKPRVFRLPDQAALINRMGLNSIGQEAVAARLAKLRRRPLPGPLGVNLGFNKDAADPAADYVAGVRAFAGLVDFLTVNVSSPNTPGLRDLQRREALVGLLGRLAEALAAEPVRPLLFVKIAPDLDGEGEAAIAETVLAAGVDALVVGNTTIDRPAELPDWAKGEAGGLSGRPLKERSTAQVARMARLTGRRLPIIGVGGIENGADAYAKIRAGASAVQLYTALIYAGPGLVGRIAAELAGLLARDGLTLAQAVGADLDGAAPPG
ncbi:MAG: quinone-dependent dihydroorotate dehydrogenase [Rhodospirillaceae bacterium]|nr:quinone-dependent dihydroorotate dehydrogenase [Rhodospirillaceae bacterium]